MTNELGGVYWAVAENSDHIKIGWSIVPFPTSLGGSRREPRAHAIAWSDAKPPASGDCYSSDVRGHPRKATGGMVSDTGDRIVDTLGKILMCVVPP